MAGRFIDVVSDSTGETAEKVVRAALLQFPQAGAVIRLHTRVRTKETARAILERASREGALVVFTVVSPELREYIHAVDLRAQGRGARRHRLAHRQARTFPRSRADQHAEQHAPALRRVLPSHRSGRVRGQERRRQGAAQLQEGRPRPRRRIAHVEDAALDAPRAARAQGRQPAARARRSAAARARRGAPGAHRRAHHRPRSALSRSARRACGSSGMPRRDELRARAST